MEHNPDERASIIDGSPAGGLIQTVIALGFTSVVTQILLLREFLSVFYGNELVIGIILGNWMILTGVGSYLGRFSRTDTSKSAILTGFLLLIGLLPGVTVCLLRLLRNIVFPVGGMIGIVGILLSSFVLLMPYCLVSGVAFTYLAHVSSRRRGENSITTVYAWEAIGGVAGGLAFNFLAVYLLTIFQTVTVVAAVNVTLALLMARLPKVGRYVLLFVSLGALGFSLAVDLDVWTRQSLFVGQEIVYSKDTPYGSVVVTRQADQLNFYENNVLLGSTNDVTTSEEAVHYAMIQHPNPKSILLISGAITGCVQEILKYGVDRIDYVELNPWLVDVAERFTNTLNTERVRVQARDTRRVVRETTGRYDVVLTNLPEPTTAQLNRYYTVEFFGELKRVLNPGAVVSTALLSTTDYQGEVSRQIYSTLSATLRSQFANVLIVPGLRTYFLASDSTLSISIARMIERRGVQNTYVNGYYIDDRALQQRSAVIERAIDKAPVLNTDFSPIAYYRQGTYWLSFFKSNYWILGLACLLALGLAAVNANAISVGMFTGGLAASSVEIVLLIAFQIIYGYVYQVVGIIVTLFMAGLALGAFWGQRRFALPRVGQYIVVQVAVGGYCVLLPIWLMLLGGAPASPFAIHAVFFLLTFIIAAVIGLEFSLATRLRRGRVASVAAELYSIDLMGSAIGALLVSAYFIPVFGLFTVSVIVGMLSLFSAGMLFIRRKNFVPYGVEGM